MQAQNAWLFLLPATWMASAAESVLLVPQAEPQRVFAGETRSISATLQNQSDATIEIDTRIRLLQTTASTAMLISEMPWKRLTLLPRQTVSDSATIVIPEVRAETRFAVQWLEGTNRVIGLTQVLAYPTNLLQELTAMVGEEGTLGVFDPANVLKPILDGLSIEFKDLEDSGVASFRGQLAILGPVPSKENMAGDLGRRVQEMAGKGVATVWIQPPPKPRDKLQPSFESVAVGSGTVVVAQHDLVANLATNPESQMNLIQLCRRALRPEPPRLPGLNESP